LPPIKASDRTRPKRDLQRFGAGQLNATPPGGSTMSRMKGMKTSSGRQRWVADIS